MEVLILGAGRVGSEIARMLVGNNCNVTVVDSDNQKLHPLQYNYDLRTINGNAANPQTLKQAGLLETDIVIAVTAIDEVNLVACKVCSILSPHITKVARIRNDQLNEASIIGKEGFSIDHVFCPEKIIADNFINAIEHPGCLSISRFANGRMALVGIRVASQSQTAGNTVAQLRANIFEIDYRILSVYRDNEFLKPDAETRLFVGDDVYLLVEYQNLNHVIPLLAGPKPYNKRILIAGGGNIGMRIADSIEKERDVKIIEIDGDICRHLSERLSKSLILRGSVTDERLLREEGIKETDLFCALTNDDEENILSSILAKKLGAKQSAAIVNRSTYVDILERDLDMVLSPSQITIGSILAFIRLGDISAVHSLRRGGAEAIEAVIHGTRETSPVVGREIQEIDWPPEAIPGALIRSDTIIMAHDDTVIENGDQIICFIGDRKAVKEVEKLLQVDFNYF